MATFGTFVSGQVLTAAELNGAGTWQDYTPSWTQSATITKTVNWARYSQFNKIIVGSVKMTATSAGTADNKVLVGLPVVASSNNFLMGTMVYFDTGNKYLYTWSFPTLYETSTTVAFGPYNAGASAIANGSSTDLRFGQILTTSGLTVASGDVIYVQFTYEAA